MTGGAIDGVIGGLPAGPLLTQFAAALAGAGLAALTAQLANRRRGAPPHPTDNDPAQTLQQEHSHD